MSFKQFSDNLPRYRCIKCVSAGKITLLLTHVDGTLDVELIGNDEKIHKIRMSADWNHKHAPELHGYMVFYDDGYTSYSPAEAFEKGYVPLSENEGSEI